MDNMINLVKLCVGASEVQDLIDWQATRRAQSEDGFARHVTRMWPKREAELLNGGSLYWVFKGEILCRQRILRLDEVTRHDGVRMCGIVLDAEIIRTAPAPKRPFQGWRYLQSSDAPPDLRKGREAEPTLPTELDRALAEIGVL
nr:DUF1489 domain-containing protein [Aliishimia ponticola]